MLCLLCHLIIGSAVSLWSLWNKRIQWTREIVDWMGRVALIKFLGGLASAELPDSVIFSASSNFFLVCIRIRLVEFWVPLWAHIFDIFFFFSYLFGYVDSVHVFNAFQMSFRNPC